MKPLTVFGGEEARHSIDLHTWIMLFVVIASVFGICLLSFSFFDVPLLLSMTACACIYIAHVFRLGLLPRLAWCGATCAIFLVALLLRSDVYPHLMGGQDQGLYTNFAHVMLHEKCMVFFDAFRAELSPGLKSIYDRVTMASVSLVSRTDSVMTIEFYPLHPMWMAVFGWAFGESYQTLSLMFFSLLYLVSAKRLTAELFEDSRAGILALLFLAINPVLVFFSKFPVTEMVAFAFSVNGMYFLYRGVKSDFVFYRRLFYILGVLCFNGLFYTRLQFFLYIPFFLMVFLGGVLSSGEWTKRRDLLLSLALLFFLFGVSLGWYYSFQNALFRGMFQGHFSRVVSFRAIVFCFMASLAVVVGYFVFRIRFGGILKKLPNALLSISGWALVLALLSSVVSIVSLYTTGLMPPFDYWVLELNDPWLIRYHVIYRFMLMLSPVGLFLLLASPWFSARIAVGGRLLLLFLASIWCVILFQPWVPYLYYYGRYLSGDALPYALIAIAGFLNNLYRIGFRLLSFLCVAFLAVYHGYYSLVQYGAIESEGVGEYRSFVDMVHKEDVLFSIGFDDRLLVPLRIKYGINIFSVKSMSSARNVDIKYLLELQAIAKSKMGRLLVVAKSDEPLNVGKFAGKATFNNYFFTNSEHVRGSDGIQYVGQLSALLLPLDRVKKSESWVFYDLSNVDLNEVIAGVCDKQVDIFLGGQSHLSEFSFLGFGWPEDHGRWSVADHGVISCLVAGGLQPQRVRMQVSAFLHGKMRQRVGVSINGAEPVIFVFDQASPARIIDLPVTNLTDRKLRIDFDFMDAKSPYEVGLSVDSRKLGLSVRSLLID